MLFTETKLAGAWIVEPEPIGDERGFFARTFCIREFAVRGLEATFVQHSISYSKTKGTLRGMHFQGPPHEEVKIVSCLSGAIRDVIVDLRPGSPTRLQWVAVELRPANRRQLYVPRGFAHGFITLAKDTLVSYMISDFHAPAAASGLRHDDPALGIEWGAPVRVVSERDRAWPLLETSPA
jgi:dTDP-4-dehydrorhamnose 3,5-epimerase